MREQAFINSPHPDFTLRWDPVKVSNRLTHDDVSHPMKIAAMEVAVNCCFSKMVRLSELKPHPPATATIMPKSSSASSRKCCAGTAGASQSLSRITTATSSRPRRIWGGEDSRPDASPGRTPGQQEHGVRARRRRIAGALDATQGLRFRSIRSMGNRGLSRRGYRHLFCDWRAIGVLVIGLLQDRASAVGNASVFISPDGG
jgi:hypothetical protein